MNKLLLGVLSLIFGINLIAQDLYIPRNVKEAYQNETRSMDGKPGKKYWQNSADYDIRVKIEPQTNLVSGTEDILYTNNSPNELRYICFRLTMNVHKPGAERDGGVVSNDYLSSGIIIDEIKETDKIAKWENTDYTYNFLELSQPLKPNQKVKLSFKWHYSLSKESSREGMIEPNTFFVAYFYPRVSVYDDIDGWDTNNFNDRTEFYNDFNNYNLEITAPKDFVVWATGDLQNIDEVLQPEIAARFKESLTSDKVVNIASLDELKSGKVTVQNDLLTWKWKADNISDVSFAVSDHYIWDGGSVIVDRKTKRRVSIQSAFNIEAVDFKQAVDYGKFTVEWSSANLPGVAYPFNKNTIFRGFGNMEYPMMINITSNKDSAETQRLVNHEILHSWFPFYMGINEQRYGIMDEGWTTAFENLITRQVIGETQANLNWTKRRVSGWVMNPKISSDIPLITPGDTMRGDALGNNQYGKAAVAYLALKDYLGDELFKKCLFEFMNRWNGKHPLPWDMFNTFNDVSGKDLNWFFYNWFYTNNYIDLAIENVSANGNDYSMKVKNIGGFAIPIEVITEYKNGKKEVLHFTPKVWSKNQQLATLSLKLSDEPLTLTIKQLIFIESNYNDNFWKF
ncbi:MAG: M1 family metallopeptidase [Pyrinomonadaceae bacterium]|nr:M1 family metallopeptidase [Pyrinomonadaceae bacterium]